jgi:KDO2-lipid IV(A) lauroyltransferase
MINFILKLFSMIPLRLNHMLGALIGWFLYLTKSHSKQVVGRNIELCFPELNQSQQKTLVKKSLIETGKSLSESGFIWYNSFEHNAKHITETQGIEHLDSAQKTILLVPHFGCWEIAGRMVSLHRPTTFMYKELRDKKQNSLLLSLREKQDLSMAAANKKGVLKMQRALKSGQLVAVLPDQYPGVEGGILSPFFAHDALTMTLLVKLARKNNAKVVLTWAQRLDKGQGYRLNLKPIEILSDSGALEEDVTIMNQVIERLVRTQPEQYLWNYKRFKGVVKY